MTFRLIDRERAHHAVSLLCSVLGVTRQGYWAWSKRPASPRRLADEQIKPQLLKAWTESPTRPTARRGYTLSCVSEPVCRSARSASPG
jgi:hypothetical protein